MMGVFISFLLAGAVALQDPAALIEQLRADDIAVRERAFAELEKLGAAAEEHLKKIVDDKDAEVASAARRLLRIIELDRSFSPALKKALPGLANRLSRDERAWTLAFFRIAYPEKHSEAPDRYADLTREDVAPLAGGAVRHSSTRKELDDVCDVVKRWGLRAADRALLAKLTDDDVMVRITVLKPLQILFGPRLLSLLLANQVVDPVLLGMAIRDDPAGAGPAIPALVEGVRQGDFDRRRASVDALASIGARESIPALIGLLKDDKEGTRVSALETLRRLRATEASAAALALLEDRKPSVQSAALWMLSDIGVDAPVDTLRKLLEIENENLSECVLKHARIRKSPLAVSAALRCLESPLAGHRRLGIEAIEAMGRREHGDRLIALIADEDKYVRNAALGASRALRLKGAVGPARKCLRDPDEYVRSSALETLVTLEAEASVEDLEHCIDAPEKSSGDATLALRLMTKVDPVKARAHLDRLILEGWMSQEFEIINVIPLLPDPMALFLKAMGSSERHRYMVRYLMRAMDRGKTVPTLRAVLRDGKGISRGEAARLLSEFGIADARAEIATLLEDPEVHNRVEAMRALVRLGPGDGVDPIRKLTTDEETQVRSEAASALGHLGVRAAIPDLRHLLQDKDAQVAFQAAKSLFTMGDPDLAADALRWLRSDDIYKCEMGSWLLVGSRSKEVLREVVRLLGDREVLVRNRAAFLLGRLEARDQARALIPLLRDFETRGAAAESIGALDARGLVPDLIKLLKSRDPSERDGALEALSSLGAREALLEIRAILKDGEAVTRLRAIKLLHQVGDSESAAQIRPFLKDARPVLREAAADALGAFRDSGAKADLIALLDDPFMGVRKSACLAVGRVGAREAVPQLLKLLKSGDQDLEPDAAWALAELGAREAVPDMISVMKSIGWPAPVAKALARLKAVECVPVLKEMIAGDKEENYEFSLLEPLGQLGDRAVLLEVLKTASPWQRDEAARVLCEVGDRAGALLVLEGMSEHSPIESLNALRKPELWKRLSGIESDLSIPAGPGREYVARLARLAGLEPQFTEASTFDESQCFRASWLASMGPLNVLEELRQLFYPSYPVCSWSYEEFETETIQPWSFILEDKGIRILPRAKAIEFWKQWWADESKVKK